MSGKFGEKSPSRPVEISAEQKAASDPSVEKQLLAQVLEETAASFQTEPLSSSSDLWEPIAEVVRRHDRQPLTLDPVAIDLVRAILASRLKGGAPSETFWRDAPRRIAQTLLEDPVSQQRLQAFWNQAVEKLS